MKYKFHSTIIGNFGRGNYGDDLLLRATLNGVRKKAPDEEICVIITQPNYLRSWYPKINFICPQSQIKTKYLIYGGGTQFYSFQEIHSRWMSRIRNLPYYFENPQRIIKRLRQLFLEKNGLQFENAAAISIGIGPFVEGSSAEVKAADALRRCQFLSVRDSTSLAWLKRWNIEGGMIYPDLIFATELWSDKPLANCYPVASPNEIGIVMRDWPHSKDGMAYFYSLYEAVNILRDEGYKIRFILFAQDYDKKSHNLLQERGESALVWDPLKVSPADFAAELGSFALLVTARAHGLVVGCALGVPTVAIEIEPKLRLIGERIQEGCSSWAKPFDPKLLVSSVEKMMADRSQLSEAVRNTAKLCAIESKESLMKMLAWMDDNQ